MADGASYDRWRYKRFADNEHDRTTGRRAAFDPGTGKEQA
jgi:hypothetical protein